MGKPDHGLCGDHRYQTLSDVVISSTWIRNRRVHKTCRFDSLSFDRTIILFLTSCVIEAAYNGPTDLWLATVVILVIVTVTEIIYGLWKDD